MRARILRTNAVAFKRNGNVIRRCSRRCLRNDCSPLLVQAETGDMDAWWNVCFWLEIEDNGHYCRKRHHMDIRELVGWKSADDPTKSRMITAAERYLSGRGPCPGEWFSRRNILYHPAVAGFRALVLLFNENQHVFRTLPCEVWRRWMPAVIRLRYYDGLQVHQMLTAEALNRVPEEATHWIVKTASQENREGEHLWVLQKLPENWDDVLGAALLKRLKQGKTQTTMPRSTHG